MKPLEKIKRAFIRMNITQQIAVGILVLFVPMSVALGVNAFSSTLDMPTSNAPVAPPVISSVVEVKESKQPSSLQASSSSSLANKSKTPVTISLKPSSIEEDLEVQIVDLKGNLVVGPEFKLTVTSKETKYNKVWTVNDGFLKLTRLKSGKYTIVIEDMEGFKIPVKTLDCEVVPKVKMEQIDVSDKIKDETQIDVSKEDASANKPKPTPAPTPALPEYSNVPAKTEEIVKEYKYKLQISTGDFPDENGNKVGYILNADSSKSTYIAQVDKDGYLVGDIKKSPAATSSVKTVSFLFEDLKGGLRTAHLNGNAKNAIVLLNNETLIPPDTTQESPTDTSSSEVISSKPIVPSESTSSESTSGSSSASESTSSESSSGSSSASEPTSSNSGSSSASEPTSSKPVPVYKDAPKAAELYTQVAGQIDPAILKTLKIEDKSVKENKISSGWSADKKSYYDANGNKIKGQVKIGGVVYNFDSSGIIVTVIKGIDVSKYQRNVDWNAVKASGVEFVIIRAGYRGYGTGALVEDPLFKSHIQGANAAGLKVGVYFFTQAVTTQEAVEEASMVLQLIKNYKITYPIYFDTEHVGDGARADNLSASHRTMIARYFCETIRNSGYRAGVYASKSWFYNQLLFEDFGSKYDIWVAHYTSSTDFRHKYDMWQYTGSGSCPGISGAVDLNWGYKNY